MSQHQTFTSNHLLGSLGPADLERLLPHLELVSLETRDVLVTPDQPITHVYFFDGGLGSVVVEGEGGKQSEVGMIGREGFAGIPVVLGRDRTSHKIFVQVAGPARRISTAALRAAMASHPTLQGVLLGAADDFLLQVAETAFANARCHLDQRLARWMLMASDRLGTTQVPLTHEFLALMLGVRRPGVTDTMHVLEGLRAVKAKRGEFTILDREMLQIIAGPSYAVPPSIASANGITITSRLPLSTIS